MTHFTFCLSVRCWIRIVLFPPLTQIFLSGVAWSCILCPCVKYVALANMNLCHLICCWCSWSTCSLVFFVYISEPHVPPITSVNQFYLPQEKGTFPCSAWRIFVLEVESAVLYVYTNFLVWLASWAKTNSSSVDNSTSVSLMLYFTGKMLHWDKTIISCTW